MGKLEKIETEVRELSPTELAAFRKWFGEYDAQAWDRQFEEDVKAGKLDSLAQRALDEHQAGRTTRL